MRGRGCYSNFSKNRKGGGNRKKITTVFQSGNNFCSSGRIAETPEVAEEEMEPNVLAVSASGLARHKSQLKQ